ncbi:MAG: ADP-ribosylglycohydrolase family protein [Chloroflexota bacterium]
MSDALIDRAYGCLVGGLIGDAMGTPTENLEPAVIEERFGWVDTFEGTGTDDSLMKDLLSDALVQTGGYATADDWAVQINTQRSRILGEKRDKFFPSVLHMVAKLRYGYLPREVSAGNMPSSSSAMAIAPVGIVNAGNPRAAAAQAQDVASLIHTGEVAFCQDGAAAIAAAVAAAMVADASVESACAAAVAHLRPLSGALMRDLIADAVKLARTAGEYRAFRSAYHQRFRQTIACDSRETVPATIALCLLAEGDAKKAIEFGANFGRDSDTIATMTGAICGALQGIQTFPSAWTSQADPDAPAGQRAMAATLVGIARAKAKREMDAWSVL